MPQTKSLREPNYSKNIGREREREKRDREREIEERRGEERRERESMHRHACALISVLLIHSFYRAILPPSGRNSPRGLLRFFEL